MPRPTAASLSALLLVSLFTALLAPFWISQPASASPDLPPDLFITPVAPAQRSAPPAGMAAVRSRPVEINPAALSAAAGAAQGRPVRINLALFSDVVYTARIEDRQATQTGGYILTGQLEGQPDSSVILSVQDNALSGSVTLLAGDTPVMYEITPSGALHRIEQVNQSAFPAELDTHPPEEISSADPIDTTAMLEDGSEIDVMVVYDSAARQQMGGTSGALSTINRAVAESNQGFANSGVIQRFNLVHTAEVNYSEVNSGSGFDWGVGLNQLTFQDGVIDEVLSWRDSYAADLTVMLVANTSYCGLAWVMTHPSVSFASHAFSLVSAACATGYYSFAHELGHNMGSVHDPANSNMEGSYPYSYGYQDPNRVFRTIMAYNCASVSCPRINYWSNPAVSYAGRPTGVANLSDNTRSLNNNSQYVANFRVRTAPVQPGPLVGIPESVSSLSLYWSDKSWNETQYHLLRSDNGSEYTHLTALPANITEYVDQTIVKGSTYQYQVVASNGFGSSLPGISPVITCDKPSPPQNLAASGYSLDQIKVSWSDTTNESGYIVERSITASGPWEVITDTVKPNTTSFIDSDRLRDVVYYYHVHAINPWEVSDASQTVNGQAYPYGIFIPTTIR